jgi:hypothetical protein
MNIREEILKLSSAAPVFKDQEDDFDYDGKIFLLIFIFNFSLLNVSSYH